MKRMWSKNELKNIADVQVKAVKKDIATLVDKDGHDRFIEGGFNISEISGITKDYAKWSLCGTHLMIVLCISLANASVISNTTPVAEFELPSYIIDKIVPLGASVVDIKQILLFNENNTSSQQTSTILRKSAATKVRIDITSITLNDDRKCRISFDLLIDNE